MTELQRIRERMANEVSSIRVRVLALLSSVSAVYSRDVWERLDKAVFSVPQVQKVMEQMENEGILASSLVKPSSGKGGMARRYYRLAEPLRE